MIAFEGIVLVLGISLGEIQTEKEKNKQKTFLFFKLHRKKLKV